MGSIAIVGLERGAGGALDARSVARLLAADKVVVPRAGSAAVSVLAAHGITPVTFDDLGLAERASASQVVEALLELSHSADVAFAAFGYPFVREGIISGILARAREGLDIYPVTSPLQVLVLALDVDVTADLEIVDAESLATAEIGRDAHVIVTGLVDIESVQASATRLLESYAPEHLVVLAGCIADGGFDFTPATLGDLAHAESVCPEAVLYVPPTKIEPRGGFDELVRTIAILRAPGGCPWDREQTHVSLGKHLIEEAYETLEAIERTDDAALADELGDVLLQVVLHAEIGAEAGTFTIDDVISGIITKIRRRHPHIFGDVQVKTAEDVTRNWDAIKREEKPARGVLGEVPHALPALMRAQKISRRAAAAGFEWEDLEGVWAKVHEEIDELKATEPGTGEAAAELGDLLFTVVNVARKMGIDAESALRETCERFSGRFEHMERASAASGRDLGELDPAAWDELWNQAKRNEADAPEGPSAGPDAAHEPR